jgi:glutamyl-tRNA reductase
MKELAITSGGSRQIALFAQLFGISEEELRAAAPVWLEEAEATEGGWMELLRQWGDRLVSDDGTASMDTAQWRAALR